MLKATYTPSQTNVDFFARNAAGQFWNGSAYANYNSANLLSYRITATETPAGSGIYLGTEPANATEYELRFRAATLADSLILAGPAETDTAEATLRANAATAATNSASIKSKTDLIGTIRSLIRW